MKIAVISSTFPELEHLAVGLHMSGHLSAYVHPFLATNRGWERAMRRLPRVGGRLTTELDRRRAPEGIDARLVRNAAAVEEIVGAIVARGPGKHTAVATTLRSELAYRRDRRLSRVGTSTAAQADVVVASQGAALKLFQDLPSNVLRVLDCPSAHHRERARLIEEERSLQPHLASTMPTIGLTERQLARYDEECKLADLIFVGSHYASDTFRHHGVSPVGIRVVPYGVDLTCFCPSAESRRDGVFRVLFVGQLSQHKGLGHLLDAYRSFRRPNTELLVLGNYVGNSQPFAVQSDLFRHVPHVPHSRVPDFTRQASVLVLPSLVEGLGLVVLEAMACGVPVIVSTNGPAEVVRDGVDGFVVAIRDTGAILRRLEQLYDDEDKRNWMGQQARMQASRYSWERYADVVLREIRKVVAA